MNSIRRAMALIATTLLLATQVDAAEPVTPDNFKRAETDFTFENPRPSIIS
jgi:hypothetical protein